MRYNKYVKISSLGEHIGRKIAEELLVMKYERERILIQDSANKPYLRRFHTRTELFKNIPLGITFPPTFQFYNNPISDSEVPFQRLDIHKDNII